MNGRREFLRRALAGGAAVAGTTACPSAHARGNAEIPPEAIGLLFDSTLCIGCKACVAACKAANDLPLDYNSPVDALWDMPLDTTARTYNVIKAWQSGTGTERNQQTDGYAFMKSSCLHCIDPSCVSACPVSAMTKDPATGIVQYDADACIGCRYCVAACPFGIPKYDYDSPTGKIGKCELCRHLLPEGKYAACAEVCPTGATLFGKVSALKAEAHRRLALQEGAPTIWPRGNLDTADQPAWEGPAPRYVQHVLRREGGRRHADAQARRGALRAARPQAAARALVLVAVRDPATHPLRRPGAAAGGAGRDELGRQTQREARRRNRLAGRARRGEAP